MGDENDFLKNLKKNENIAVYWNKIPEPDQIVIEKKIIKNLEDKKIKFKFFKGNILNEYNEVTKGDGTPFKVFSPFWRVAEQIYINKIPSKISKLKKLGKKNFFFNKSSNFSKILPNKKWYKKFEKYWSPSETNANITIKKLISDKISSYDVTRDYPSIEGTSKISPFLKHGQVHVETIWNECQSIKNKKI